MTEQIGSAGEQTRTHLTHLQAEGDRREAQVEARLVELEQVLGDEAGVDRQLLLDRIEEMERGLVELDPERFASRSEFDALRTRLDGERRES